jgi:hypothetical protein
MNHMLLLTMREVLEQAAVFDGWLFLPQQPWTLDTVGIFIKEDRDADPSDPFPPAILAPCGLQVALDAAGIEDVIENAKDQLGAPRIDQLFAAFQFYIENDAFLEFDK